MSCPRRTSLASLASRAIFAAALGACAIDEAPPESSRTEVSFDLGPREGDAVEAGVGLDGSERADGSTFDGTVNLDAGEPSPTDAGGLAPIDAGEAPDGGDGPPRCSAWQIAGDPTSARGATWTFQSTEDGVEYELAGILLAPSGPGPFPAVVVSHGRGGRADGYSRTIGLEMRTWGLLVIATDYTYARGGGGLPVGPVGQDDGASLANIQRGHLARRLLSCRSDVDLSRIAAHGHSMGAMVTATLLGRYPNEFLVGSQTAGGVSETGTVNDGVFTTPEADALQIRAPFQIHHGSLDDVVDPTLGQRLVDLLNGTGVPHEWWLYPGYDHSAIAQDQLMLERVHLWYQTHGLVP